MSATYTGGFRPGRARPGQLRCTCLRGCDACDGTGWVTPYHDEAPTWEVYQDRLGVWCAESSAGDVVELTADGLRVEDADHEVPRDVLEQLLEMAPLAELDTLRRKVAAVREDAELALRDNPADTDFSRGIRIQANDTLRILDTPATDVSAPQSEGSPPRDTAGGSASPPAGLVVTQLYWHCECGNNEPAQADYEHGDLEPCCLCADGTARVVTIEEAAAWEQAKCLGRPWRPWHEANGNDGGGS